MSEVDIDRCPECGGKYKMAVEEADEGVRPEVEFVVGKVCFTGSAVYIHSDKWLEVDYD